MRKIRILLVALVAALLMSVMTAPAQAVDDTTKRCITYGRGALGDAKVCVAVDWHRQADGQGLVVTQVTLTATPEYYFENGPAVDGHSLYIINGGGTVKWSKDGTDCDIPGTGYRAYAPDLAFNANQGAIYYFYKPRLNNWPDPSDEMITFSFGV